MNYKKSTVLAVIYIHDEPTFIDSFDSTNTYRSVFGKMRWNYHSILVASTIQPLGVFSYDTGSNDANVCTSAKCQDYAKFLKESMASNYESIDPCTNFDKYSCDGWVSKHDWRVDQTSVSVTSVMVDQNHNLLHALLEGDYAENTTFTGTEKTADQQNFLTLKKLYKTCMNEDAIKTYGVAPLKKITDEFNTIFPGNRSGPISVEELSKTMSWLAKNAVAGLAGAAPSVGCSLAICFHFGIASCRIRKLDGVIYM